MATYSADRIHIVTSVAILFFLHITACDKTDPLGSELEREEVSANQLYSLNAGNLWKFLISPAPISGGDSIVVESVTADTVVNSEQWFYLVQGEGNRLVGQYYRNNEQGMWVLSLSPTPTSKLVYKYPAVVNDKYVAFDATDTIRVAGVDVTTTVPAGTYDCYVYERRIPSDSTTFYHHTYIHPGLGKVKEEIFLYDKQNQKVISSQYLLLEYSLQ